jgi:hypothetical protein
MLTDNTAVIKDLEMNKFVTAIIKRIILSKFLNSPSFRFFFYIILVGKEKSTNSFFKLLDSFNRNAEVF